MAVDAHGIQRRADRTKRPSLLWIGISTLLIQAGFGRRSEPRRERAPAERTAASEPNRGRTATKPSEIQARGWRDILGRTWTAIGKDRLSMVAAGVAFFAVLSLFPALGALVSVYGLFADPASIQGHLRNLENVLPPDALSLIGGELTRISQAGGAALGVGFVIGLALSIWSANAGMKTMFDALNLVYEEDEKRGFLMLNARSLAFTIGGLVLVLLAMGAVVALPIVLRTIGLGSAAEWIISLARWPILLLLIIPAIAALYRYGPSRERPRWRWVSWGAAVATLLWLAASLLFSWYVASFADYNKTYGSLGAMIGLMMWIWVSSYVILVGAELDAETEHQTTRDTTTGSERPVGARGARMADTIGERRN